MAAASAKPNPTRSGWWASLAKLTASPPVSNHQRTILGCKGMRVFTSRTRPDLLQRAQDRAQLILEVGRVERLLPREPTSERVVDVRQDLKGARSFDHAEYLL